MAPRVPIDSTYRPSITDVGQGPPVVLVHGTPLDAKAWDGLVPRLAARHRVIAYDLRGHGSARSCPLPGTYAPLIDDLALLLDELGLERAHVAGHSFGGQVAASFAVAHPERVEALTVVCPRSTPFPPFAAAAEAIERDGIRSVAASALARWFTPEALARDAPAVRYARSCLSPEAAPTLAAAFASSPASTSPGDSRRCGCPPASSRPSATPWPPRRTCARRPARRPVASSGSNGKPATCSRSSSHSAWPGWDGGREGLGWRP